MTMKNEIIDEFKDRAKEDREKKKGKTMNRGSGTCGTTSQVLYTSNCSLRRREKRTGNNI